MDLNSPMESTFHASKSDRKTTRECNKKNSNTRPTEITGLLFLGKEGLLSLYPTYLRIIKLEQKRERIEIFRKVSVYTMNIVLISTLGFICILETCRSL